MPYFLYADCSISIWRFSSDLPSSASRAEKGVIHFATKLPRHSFSLRHTSMSMIEQCHGEMLIGTRQEIIIQLLFYTWNSSYHEAAKYY
jgi:hypothetical protein